MIRYEIGGKNIMTEAPESLTDDTLHVNMKVTLWPICSGINCRLCSIQDTQQERQNQLNKMINGSGRMIMQVKLFWILGSSERICW